ncbi:hypothetical protein ASPZODRAFT_166437 [Penicilliopsis zonata CBS 506.65]|uniref:Mediator of RNA polymerase II transcription subunit 21 n=1 Tax=Penicilliopsis zonata CBS 506.65 TaxID=1073090 RepID=A0A1L9SJE6_9EURO|nr:hypothetical protein ASPZODRAFT_166437 [Penicilliopsis zonata CBS 506.65]OJJ47213.1 hypothetical protein ASPZODRAFT_166437 [Penicilliopsis zonata CBS 506.65]
MADILTQLQTCLDQLATQFYATLSYLTTYHDNSPATPPSNTPNAAPALAKIPKNSTAPPVPASAPVLEPETPAPAPAQLPQGDAHQGKDTPGGPAGAGAGAGVDPALPPAPDSPRTFARRQRELARDLIIKEQQIEYLISVLPGIGSSETEQEARIRELEKDLRAAEAERESKAQGLKVLRKRLENVLGAVEVGIYGDREISLS